MQHEIVDLLTLGPFPSEDAASEADVTSRQKFIEAIAEPITNEEATALVGLLGNDTFFGLAWAVVQLIESSPGWPLRDALPSNGGPWVDTLRRRAVNSGLVPPALP